MTVPSSADATFGEAFSVSGRVDVPVDSTGAAGTLVSYFDPARRRGVNLGLIAGGGGYSAPGNQFRVTFGIDDGSEPAWEDCGKPSPQSHYVSNSLTVSNGELYAATTDAPRPLPGARIFRYRGGQHWQNLSVPAEVDARGIGPMIAHNNELYMAPWTYDWTVVDDLDLSPVHVYRLGAGDEWIDCGQPGRCRRIFSLASFDGRLYAAGDDDRVHVLDAGGHWSPAVTLPGYPHPMHVHSGRLWVGTVDPGSIWSFDGESWRDEGNPERRAEDASQIHSFGAYRGELVMGSWPLGRVSRLDAGTGQWSSLGSPVEAIEINALQTFNGMLYAGSMPYAEVARLDGSIDGSGAWSQVLRFNVREGRPPVTIADSGWRSRQEMAQVGSQGGSQDGVQPVDDSGMRDWGRVTSMTEFSGKLYVSTGNGTSAHRDTERHRIIGTVYAMSTGIVLNTPRALSPGRHHIAAVRDGLTLRLHVDGECVAQRSGKRDRPLDLSGDLPRAGSGLMDEEWHDRALSFDEISAAAQARPAR